MNKNNQSMNIQAQFTVPFTQIQNTIIESPYFKQPIDKMVYITLLKFAFNKGLAYPSIKTISTMQNVSENTVRSSIKRLEELNLVKVEKRIDKKGNFLSNLYYVFDLDYNFTLEHYLEQQEEKSLKETENKISQNEKSNNTNGLDQKEQGVLQNLKRGTSIVEEKVLQNLKEGTSIVEGEEYIYNNINIKNNNINNIKEYLSIIIQENDLNLATKKRLVKSDMIDRLILLSNKLSIKFEKIIQDIEDLQSEYTDVLTVDQFNSCLVDCLNSNITKNFKQYLRSALETKIKAIQDKVIRVVDRKNHNDPEIPEWFKTRKPIYKKQEENRETVTTEDINDILNKFRSKAK